MLNDTPTTSTPPTAAALPTARGPLSSAVLSALVQSPSDAGSVVAPVTADEPATAAAAVAAE